MRNLDWKADRDRIDLAQVATGLLGPAPGRRGEKGKRLWWPCPFHSDVNPSFCVNPGNAFWKCHGCGETGDAANLVMRLERLTFPEAMSRLFGETTKPTPAYQPPPRRVTVVSKAEEPPQGLPLADALALVKDAEARLWTDEATRARNHLIHDRGLTAATLRSGRIGWTPRVEIPTKNGKMFRVRGIVIPWFDGDRLALVKIRREEGARPKYAEAFRDRPTTLPTHPSGTVGGPLIVVEGELDALLLGQELTGLATVLTLGSASGRPDITLLSKFLGLSPWFVATDADSAGERAADHWPARARRVRPPSPFKDWTEAAQGGVILRRWWTDRLAGVEAPGLFAWSDLSSRHWGDADDAPGIDIPADNWRWEVACWPVARWLIWKRCVDELLATEPPVDLGPEPDPGELALARAERIGSIERRAYEEMVEAGSDDSIN